MFISMASATGLALSVTARRHGGVEHQPATPDTAPTPSTVRVLTLALRVRPKEHTACRCHTGFSFSLRRGSFKVLSLVLRYADGARSCFFGSFRQKIQFAALLARVTNTKHELQGHRVVAQRMQGAAKCAERG